MKPVKGRQHGSLSFIFLQRFDRFSRTNVFSRSRSAQHADTMVEIGCKKSSTFPKQVLSKNLFSILWEWDVQSLFGSGRAADFHMPTPWSKSAARNPQLSQNKSYQKIFSISITYRDRKVVPCNTMTVYGV